MTPVPKFENAGIGSWMVRLFDAIDEGNLGWILSLARRCEALFGTALVDLVPSYTTLLIQYDPLAFTPDEARAVIRRAADGLAPENGPSEAPVKKIPVWYDPTVGPDLPKLASRWSMGVDEVVELHAGTEYRVYALGFAPGFAFMGVVDPALETTRLSTPRQRVHAGSVAIAGRQTSAYPAVSPGGWNIIGRTPITLFDRQRDEMSFLQVGDRVRMVPVTKGEFLKLGGDPTPQEEA